MIGKLGEGRYVMIDMLDSGRGRWVATIVFGSARGSLTLWLLGWGVLLGWISAAVLAIPIGYFCR